MRITFKIVKWGIIFSIIIALLIIYQLYDPGEIKYFPKCLFLQITGFKCTGCGSQRAIHHLLNFQIVSAMQDNLLVVMSIPYIILGFIFDFVKNPSDKVLRWRSRLYGVKAIYVVLALVLSFWILRNIPWKIEF